MKESATLAKTGKIAIKAGVILVWLLLWQVAALAVGSRFLFPDPLAVIKRLAELAPTPVFLKNCGLTLLRISAGWFIGAAAGTLMGALTAFSKALTEIFSPLLTVVKTTPVASIIILLLLWVSRTGVTVTVCALLVAPILWANTAQGIKSADGELLEMADSYSFSPLEKLRYIYLPAAFPSFAAGVTTSIGFAWKSGISAEIIATPKNALGTQIFISKLNLEYADLFAYTLAVIIMSLIIEKAAVYLLDRLFSRRQRRMTDD